MRLETIALVLALVVVLVAIPGPSLATPPESPDGPRIVELYPNPVAENNVGEYIVVTFPEPTNGSRVTLTDDGRGEATLPPEEFEGTVAFSHDPELARNHTDHPVRPLNGWLRPAADGDRIELGLDGTVVDAVRYDRAPEGERWLRSDGGRWEPVGATDHGAVVTNPDRVDAFVLPDAPDQPEAVLRSARRRLLLAGYTVTGNRTVRALLDATDRGVDVEVVVEGAPVGGVSKRQFEALDRLVAAGVEVTVVGGEHARYRFHHAKYAVADDRVLVTTENWKPSGTGGRSSRGWGVVIDHPPTAQALAKVFETDTGWRDGIPWEAYRDEVDPVKPDPASGRYPSAFDPASVRVESASVIVAPDNAESELIALLDGANESIRIQQVSIGGIDSALMAATIDAARRGVDVEIQLSSAWYVEEQNRDLAGEIERLSADEDLPISVHMVDPRSRFRRVHTKGVVVDDRHVVVGSINWNDHSLRENREVAVVLTGDDVGAYYSDVLTADRRGGVWRLPVGMALALLLGVLGAGGICRRRLRWRPRCQSSCSPGPRRSRRPPSSRRERREPPPGDP